MRSAYYTRDRRRVYHLRCFPRGVAIDRIRPAPSHRCAFCGRSVRLDPPEYQRGIDDRDPERK